MGSVQSGVLSAGSFPFINGAAISVSGPAGAGPNPPIRRLLRLPTGPRRGYREPARGPVDKLVVLPHRRR